MERKSIKQYEMLVRVRDFGANHREAFPETSRAGKAFATIDTVVRQLREHAVLEMSARPRRRGRPTPRQAVLTALAEIARTAKAIKASDRSFDNKFLPPRPQPRQALIAAARSFVREAEPIAELFVAHELPPTFIADLQGLIDTLEQSVSQRDAQRGARTAARVKFGTTLEAGLAALRQLDVLVPNRLKKDPATLAVWEVDRRLDYRVRRKPEAAAAPTTTLETTPDTEAA